MPGKRQLVLVRFGTKPDGTRDPSVTKPLGPAREIKDSLAKYNTAPDGAASMSMGTEMLHGPGMVVELPPPMDGSKNAPVNQALVNVSDEDIAWPVLSRACKSLGWSMMDVESGKVFG